MTTRDGRAESAPAKINLALHVLGRRADGMHELDGIVAFTEAGDRLSVAPAGSGVHLEVSGPFAAAMPADEDNLVLKAAKLLAGERAHPGALIRLDKQLPVAAGIGGGSADAAAALRLLDRFWDLRTDRGRLAELAARLGADVPMCLVGRPARIFGIGEQLTPLALPPLDLVLVNPGRELPTRTVFATHRVEQPSPLSPLPGAFGSARDLVAYLKATRNDLTGAAISLRPEINEALRALEAKGALLARMSGSGATVFGVFGDAAGAERAARATRAEKPLWWAVATRTLLPGADFSD